MHNTIAHYPLTKANPIPEQQSAPLGQLLPVSTLGMMLCGVEYPFGQFAQLSQMSSPPSPGSCAAPHFQSMRHWKALGSG